MTRFWIGGSPCAGKSSIAALLADRHGLRLFTCDDGTAPRMDRMAGRGLAARDELAALDTCVRLARPPRAQVELVLGFYAEQFRFLLDELPSAELPSAGLPSAGLLSAGLLSAGLPSAGLPDGGPLLVEGADLLPSLLAGAGVPMDRSVWIVPTAEFQVRHYAERPWVGPHLASCPDPAAAFDSWMRRDILFARHVRMTAEQLGGRVIVVDGGQTLEQTASVVERHFGLSRIT